MQQAHDCKIPAARSLLQLQIHIQHSEQNRSARERHSLDCQLQASGYLILWSYTWVSNSSSCIVPGIRNEGIKAEEIA